MCLHGCLLGSASNVLLLYMFSFEIQLKILEHFEGHFCPGQFLYNSQWGKIRSVHRNLSWCKKKKCQQSMWWIYVSTTCTTHTQTLELAGQPTARLPKRFSSAAGLIEKTRSVSDVQCAPALLLSTATPLHPAPSIRRDFVSVTIYLFVYLLSFWDKNYISQLPIKWGLTAPLAKTHTQANRKRGTFP